MLSGLKWADFINFDSSRSSAELDTTVFQKKTSTHIIDYKLRNSCLIWIIFDTIIPNIIWRCMTDERLVVHFT